MHVWLARYKHMIGTVQLWGPTNFAPIIDQVCKIASETHAQAGSAHYYVRPLCSASLQPFLQPVLRTPRRFLPPKMAMNAFAATLCGTESLVSTCLGSPNKGVDLRVVKKLILAI